MFVCQHSPLIPIRSTQLTDCARSSCFLPFRLIQPANSQPTNHNHHYFIPNANNYYFECFLVFVVGFSLFRGSTRCVCFCCQNQLEIISEIENCFEIYQNGFSFGRSTRNALKLEFQMDFFSFSWAVGWLMDWSKVLFQPESHWETLMKSVRVGEPTANDHCGLRWRIPLSSNHKFTTVGRKCHVKMTTIIFC